MPTLSNRLSIHSVVASGGLNFSSLPNLPASRQSSAGWVDQETIDAFANASLWIDAFTTYTDVGGTTPATTGDPIAAALDYISGNLFTQANAASQPTLAAGPVINSSDAKTLAGSPTDLGNRRLIIATANGIIEIGTDLVDPYTIGNIKGLTHIVIGAFSTSEIEKIKTFCISEGAASLSDDDFFRAYVTDATTYSTTDTNTTFGSLSGSVKWVGGALAPNGSIYGIPSNSTTVLKINPTTDTAITFGSLSSTSSKWTGGVLAPNGSIYGIPFSSTTILKVDSTTDTATTFGSLFGTGKWSGGVLAPNGCIYGIPFSSTTILKIDPTTDTITTFGSLSGTDKWSGGVLAPNGCIYGIPYDSTTVLKIDPITDTTSTFGSLFGTGKWSNGVLALNGSIYGIPRNSLTILKIDPTTDTATTFGSLSGSVKWGGGVLAPNGSIYGIPRNSSTIVKIDPTTDTTTTFGSFSGNTLYFGGVLAPNGSIYGIPGNSTTVLKVLSGSSVDSLMLSAFANKF